MIRRLIMLTYSNNIIEIEIIDLFKYDMYCASGVEMRLLRYE